VGFALPTTRCYIVAQAGSNHDGQLEQALRLIDVAVDAGVDAVKFQVFRAQRLYAPGADDAERAACVRDEMVEVPPEWLPQLARRARERAIDFLASALEPESVDAVNPWVSAHSCPSDELTNHPLLAHMARKGKPLIVSTGAAEMAEVAAAVAAIRAAGDPPLVLLQCTAGYPAPLDALHLRAMHTLELTFSVPVGLSDHSRHPTVAPAAAVALGACVVEKHYTLSNGLTGPDHHFALEPRELTEMVAAVRATEAALGYPDKRPAQVEVERRRFARRSIYTVRAVRRGEQLTSDNVAVLRCGKQPAGLPPAAFPTLLGRLAARDLRAGHPVADIDLATG
jgi:N-acetylneuraminate synthase